MNIRVCSECGKKILEGFVFDGGAEYYCSEECLKTGQPEVDPIADYEDNSDYIYWTEWEWCEDIERSDFNNLENFKDKLLIATEPFKSNGYDYYKNDLFVIVENDLSAVEEAMIFSYHNMLSVCNLCEVSNYPLVKMNANIDLNSLAKQSIANAIRNKLTNIELNSDNIVNLITTDDLVLDQSNILYVASICENEKIKYPTLNKIKDIDCLIWITKEYLNFSNLELKSYDKIIDSLSYDKIIDRLCETVDRYLYTEENK